MRTPPPPKIVFALSLGLFATCLTAPQLSRSETKAPQVFSFHMPTEPSSVDPAMLSSSDASYFLTNVLRGLYVYDDKKGLVPEGAESCRFETPLRLTCKLATQLWSDGSPVVAEDYVRGFRRLVRPNAKNLSVELLKSVKNAIAVNAGQMPPESLGIRAETPKKLVIEFEKPDAEFLYKLTYSVLVPVKTETFPNREESANAVVNGPYKIASWVAGRRIRLQSNPHYRSAKTKRSVDRPPVEILILDDDQTALNLYEQGDLTFLRRLPTTYIPAYRKRADFLQIPVLRFDYVGFGRELKEEPDYRRALSLSADFEELAKVLDANGTPGCPGLRSDLMEKITCVKFDLPRAKALYARLSPEAKKIKLRLTVSKLGGDDVKKSAEWFQAQWKKNLGVDVEIEQLEQTVNLQRLRSETPPIYRKGLHPERPTCLAALEVFGKTGADNFLKIEDPEFEDRLKKLELATQETSKSDLRRACTKAIDQLVSEARLVPLGRIHFTLLASPKFSGWSLNEMNQLNLANLAVAK
jgi:oligopeptide transport system substrate-binding protein